MHPGNNSFEIHGFLKWFVIMSLNDLFLFPCQLIDQFRKKSEKITDTPPPKKSLVH